MRALRTAQPRRACDTTVFSCANRGDGVPGQWPPIIRAWPVRRVRRRVSLSHCGQLTSFQPNVRRYGAFLRDPGQVPLPIAWRKGLGSAQRAQTAHGSAPSRHFPAPLRRSAESRPRADQCARDGRDHPSPLDARRSGAERCTVVLVALCLCAVARVHVAVATSTHLAVETITNVYTRSQYVIYWLSQLELPPLEITWARL